MNKQEIIAELRALQAMILVFVPEDNHFVKKLNSFISALSSGVLLTKEQGEVASDSIRSDVADCHRHGELYADLQYKRDVSTEIDRQLRDIEKASGTAAERK